MSTPNPWAEEVNLERLETLPVKDIKNAAITQGVKWTLRERSSRQDLHKWFFTLDERVQQELLLAATPKLRKRYSVMIAAAALLTRCLDLTMNL